MKDEDILVYSSTLHRGFTREQWWDYLKEHEKPQNEIIVSCNGFDFTLFGCCMNPRKEVGWSNKSCEVEITVAQSENGLWTCGLYTRFNISTSWSAPVFDEHGEGYPTDKDAVYHGLEIAERKCLDAIEYLKDYYSSVFDDDYYGEDNAKTKSSVIPKVKDALDNIRRMKEEYSPSQLTLF